MPIKSVESIKFGTMINGEFKEIINIPTLDSDELEVSNRDIDDFGLHGSSIERTCTIKLSKKQSRRMFELLVPNCMKNNYRKRHGIPMRRKVR
jgi:hypothetical protein